MSRVFLRKNKKSFFEKVLDKPGTICYNTIRKKKKGNEKK
jgi:hypothetical protein